MSLTPSSRVSPPQLLGALLFAMGMIEWSSAWFFPVDGRNLFTITRPFGSQYRVALWCVVSAGAVTALASGRLRAFAGGFAPYLVLVCAALAATLLGDQTADSAWYVAQWLVMVVAGLAVGVLTPAPLLRRTGLLVFAAVLGGSLLLYLAVPSIGSMQVNGRGGLLRGLFPGKQFAGWFAALACIWWVGLRTRRVDAFGVGLMLLAGVVLVRAQSAGAIVALSGGLAYYLLIRLLRPAPIAVAAKCVVLTLVLGAAVAAAQIGLPMLLTVLGRDPTLTGRTEIWAMYWRFMQNSELIGRGPGAFAAGSDLNFIIAPHLDKDYVVTSHSLYLALFGDIGILGLAAYVCGVLYIAVVSPMRRPGVQTTAAGVLAMMILASGFTESRDTLVPSVATFLILALRGVALSEDAAPITATKPAPQATGATPPPPRLPGRTVWT